MDNANAAVVPQDLVRRLRDRIEEQNRELKSLERRIDEIQGDYDRFTRNMADAMTELERFRTALKIIARGDYPVESGAHATDVSRYARSILEAGMR
jgi:septal ring factor EnvC (AmiA/AmiB activator)